MPRHLKRGMDASAIKAAEAKVRETVEHILADIDERKDVAVRELSQKFDNWAPASFKLTPQENGKWKYTALHKFTGGADGAGPNDVIVDDKGNIFGTTFSGGKNGFGVAFEITP